MPKNKTIPDEWMLFALKQAACIHRQDEVIQEIVGKAICELRYTSRQQKKRRFAKTKKPARIYLDDIHVLQRLVFLLSEPHEKAQETYAQNSISERELIIRYLAFIVRKIMRRNFLYGVTGVCRFICNYKSHDVREIYQILLDEPHPDKPDRFKTEDEFRQNRQKMRDMIFKRFQKHLRIQETRNGKERHFLLRQNQNDLSLIRLIKKSLDVFKPWRTECLPDIFRQPDEHRREIGRLHALIHPDCFSALTTVLQVDAPDTRLGIPQFFFVKPFSTTPSTASDSNGGSSTPFGSSGDDSSNAASQEQMLEVLRKRLAEHAEKLERFFPEGMLTIKIDGKDTADFNLDVTNRVQFTVDNEEAERIEIVAQSEQLALAIHLLDDEVWHSQTRKCFYTVRHENGAKITFMFRLIENVDPEKNKLSVTVTYKETRPGRYLALLWRRLRIRILSWKPVIELSPEMQQTIEGNPQWAKQLEEGKPTWVNVIAWYCSTKRILWCLLPLILLAFAIQIEAWPKLSAKSNAEPPPEIKPINEKEMKVAIARENQRLRLMGLMESSK
jgi:hypothetical protein